MSLKAFHVFFIAISAIFATGLGVWSLAHYLYHGGGTVYLVMGPLAIAAALGLVYYGQLFLKKTRDMGYL